MTLNRYYEIHKSISSLRSDNLNSVNGLRIQLEIKVNQIMATNQGTRREYKQTKRHKSNSKREDNANVSKSTQIRRQEKAKRKQEKLQSKKPRRRIFPIWLRIIVVLLFSVVALVAGLMIGYGIIGDGLPTDVLKFETWQHIIDIVNKEE